MALALGQANPRTRVVTEVIEAVGIVATATGEAKLGATLLGAAEAVRERIGLRYGVQENQAALFISVRTVENHVARIFAKFGVRTRTAAVTRAIASGLVEPTGRSPA